MKVKMENSSSQKTRKKIQTAFAKLVSEKKDINKITVTELVKLADITRGTFYTHYDNIYDIAKNLQDDTLDVLITNLEKLKTSKNIDLFFDTIINYIKENEEMYSLILSSNDPLIFINNINYIIQEKLQEMLTNTKRQKDELKIILFLDGIFSLVIKYFQHEIQYNLDEIGKCAKNTCKKLF